MEATHYRRRVDNDNDNDNEFVRNNDEKVLSPRCLVRHKNWSRAK